MHPPSAVVTVYHCLCTEICIATTKHLQTLRKRKLDASAICKLQLNLARADALLQSVATDATAIVVRLEDGFEKRYPARCGRCGLMVGYQLDKAQYEDTRSEMGRREDLMYILLGAVKTTEEMLKGRPMELQGESVAVAAG